MQNNMNKLYLQVNIHVILYTKTKKKQSKHSQYSMKTENTFFFSKHSLSFFWNGGIIM